MPVPGPPSPEPRGSGTRLVMVGGGAIGDAIHAMPAIRALRASRQAGDEIAYESFLYRDAGVKTHATLASDLLVPLGLVDRVRHRHIAGGLRGTIALTAFLVGCLLNPRVGAVIVLLAFDPTRRMPRLLAWLARWSPKLRFPGDRRSGARPSADRPLCWHNLECLRESGLTQTPGAACETPFLDPPAAAVEEADRWLRAHRQRPERRLIAVCPGVSYPANQWPAERFIDLVRRIEALGQFEVALCGGAMDRDLCARIAGACPGTLVAAGELSIYGTAALFQRAAVVVGLDTGTTHLAAACGAPYVALYGQRGFGRWHFPPCPAIGIVLQTDVPCRHCRLIACNQPGHPCMIGLTVDAVMSALLATAR